MLSTCSISGKESHPQSVSDEAPRFNLATLSKNVWRVPDSSIEGGEKPETFHMRREVPANGALLIKSESTGLVFLFDPEARQLELSTESKWQASTDKISECVNQWGGLVDIEQPEYKAVLWKTWKDLPIQVTVDISGRHQWGDMLMSPTEKKLAVFSFDGPYKGPNFILFGAGKAIRGNRHIDFFEVVKPPGPVTPVGDGRPQLRPLGQTVTIKDPLEGTSMEPCWTLDEEFIVIPDYSSPSIWIVEVKA